MEARPVRGRLTCSSRPRIRACVARDRAHHHRCLGTRLNTATGFIAPGRRPPRPYVAASRSCIVALDAHAQGQGRGRGAAAGPPPTARASAPKDFTGYWVSIVTEHWHLRMLVPPKGTTACCRSRRRAQDCRHVGSRQGEGRDRSVQGYGPPALMRVPGRLNIHWTDDNTLQLDTDSGTQMRSFRFGVRSFVFGGPVAARPPMASWEFLARAAAAPPSQRHWSIARADDPDDGVFGGMASRIARTPRSTSTSTRSPSPTATRGSS